MDKLDLGLEVLCRLRENIQARGELNRGAFLLAVVSFEFGLYGLARLGWNWASVAAGAGATAGTKAQAPSLSPPPHVSKTVVASTHFI